MKDLEYLRLLSKTFPNIRKAAAEVINLRAICGLPKGTEYFFSDLHGEYESFIHLLRSSSGIIRAKIEETFGDMLPEADQLSLANLIYYPRKVLAELHRKDGIDEEWQRITINKLIRICQVVSSKYTRSKVRKKMPIDYAYAIDELLHIDLSDENKRIYYQEIINAVITIDTGDEFIIALCELIQKLTIDSLHIIGDIFDRGPRADIIMEELMGHSEVDIEWGNHDVSWMGAAAGNTACIANVLRIATSYNSFDVLEDGYGINLRPLSMFAASVYSDDPCEAFRPHILDENVYDSVNPSLAAKMCKAITVIQFKLEGQLIRRHPEYGLEDRLLLDKIDFDRGTVRIGDREVPLKDTGLPTVDPASPYTLTPQEEELMNTLRLSFMHSQILKRHIRFLYSHGSIYRVCNGNLLYHGCIPMEEDGSFQTMMLDGKTYGGRALMDILNQKIIDAYYLDGRDFPEEKAAALDLMWYLWCGPKSPVFGKDKITTFEQRFTDEKELCRENYNAYYRFSREEKTVDRILTEFGLTPEDSHIINGHVPVKTIRGESPVKADGKLYIIDGGLSKAYQEKTGIAGYTLIYNSHHLALAEHRPYVPGEENTPKIRVVEQMKKRKKVKDTDRGKELLSEIEALEDLIEAYRKGLLREHG